MKTAEELYKFITDKMKPEDALMKILQSATIQYEKLKFDKDSQIHPVIIVSMAACDMGWQMVIEKNVEDIEGIMIGTPDFIERNLKEKYDTKK